MYTLDISISLGAAKAGLVLNGQLVDSTGANVGGAITSGFAELGGGNYLLAAAIPDLFSGAIKIFEASAPSVILTAGAVNPAMSGTGGGGGTTFGAAGSVAWEYTVFDTDALTRLPGVAIYVSADAGGVLRSQIQVSDDLGRVQFQLDPGAIYVWRLHPYRTFDDPDIEEVLA